MKALPLPLLAPLAALGEEVKPFDPLGGLTLRYARSTRARVVPQTTTTKLRGAAMTGR